MRGFRTFMLAAVVLAACGDNLEGNQAPTIGALALITDEDTPVTRPLPVSDADGDPLTLTASGAQHGTTTIDGGSLTYRPDANYHGTDSIRIEVSDGKLAVQATVSVSVTSVNDVPVAGADALAAQEDTAAVVAQSALLANDTDADEDTLSITAVGAATHGTVALTGSNVTFTPDADYTGPATFEYTVSDGTATATGAVAVTVGGANDAPVAVDDTAATDEDVVLELALATLTGNDTDPEGQTLTITGANNPTGGSVTIAGGNARFTPSANWSGTGGFDYTVSDGAATDVGHVTVTVRPVNDAPVAVDDTATTPEDTAVGVPAATLIANDTDVDTGTTLTVTAVGAATHGTVALAGGTATFTPEANYAGPATFEYTVSDGTATDTGVVTVTVTPVNDGPTAIGDMVMTAEDTALPIAAATLLANDTDPDSTPTLTAVSNPVNGTVSLAAGTITFTPAADFTGPAAFQYTITDGSLTSTTTVGVTVTPVNDAPVAVDDAAITAEDTALVLAAGALLANDTDVDGTPTISAVGGAVNGTVSLAAGSVTFTPAADFAGTARFDYTITDGSATDSATVTVTVTAVDDAPVAVDDATSTGIDQPVQVTAAAMLANDTDVDTAAAGLSITGVQDPVNGTVVFAAGVATFTPAEGFQGAASFGYVVSDGTSTDTGLVVVTVEDRSCGNGAIDAGEQCDDGDRTAGDGCDASCQRENGWQCAGAPSLCTTLCGDGIPAGTEQCDDGNADQTDGCTTACVDGVVCDAAAFPGGDRFAVDQDTGHCFVSYDDDQTTFAAAQTACVGVGGYLATVTTPTENVAVVLAHNPAQNPWIGAQDDGNDTDAIFAWVTGEPFGFTAFAPGQPDDDAGDGGNGECLHLTNAAGQWNDTNCTFVGFVTGRLCEIEPEPCGDRIRQPFAGEECDDGGTAAGDGCSATCQLEDGCGDGNLDAGEECDDDGTAAGDGCGATCQLEDGCGDGNLDAGEECDDDGVASGDGCSATCQFEGCGDGDLDPGETCDDGGRTDGDGCSATCQQETTCGNNAIDPGEQCDDGGQVDGDGCSATCQRELVSIAVAPTVGTIDRQQRVQLKATGTFGPAGNQVTQDVTATAAWTSSDPTVATVGTGGTNNGRVDALAVSGSTAVRATVGTIFGETTVTVGANTCSIKINEVQVAGDSGTAAADEFIELYNPCTTDISVASWVLVYRSATGTSDTSVSTLAGTMAAGSYRLYVGPAYNGGGTPDGTFGAGSGVLGAAGGGVGLRSSAGGTLIDSVGYGTATNIFVEGTAAAAPPANSSIRRGPYDGRDTNANSADFATTATPTPRATNFP